MALATALDRILAMNAAERATMAAAGIGHVHRHFSRELMCARTLEVYAEVLAAPAAAPAHNPVLKPAD